MRSESDGVVTYRSDLYWFALGMSGVGASLVVVAIVVGSASGGRLLPAIALVLWVLIGWLVSRPRVELHTTHVLVVTPYRAVKLDYHELRPPEFSGSYTMTGPLLRLIGRLDRATVWPGGGGSPPPWQVELEAELSERIT